MSPCIFNKEEEVDLVSGPVEQTKAIGQSETLSCGRPTGIAPQEKRKKHMRKKLQEILPFHRSIDTPGSGVQERNERTQKVFKKKATRIIKHLKPLPGWEGWAKKTQVG